MKQPETKLPYGIDKYNNSNETSFIVDDDSNFVARSVRNKDAEFIVHACNNYSKLVDLLKTIKRDAEMALSQEWDKSDDGFECQLTLINDLLMELDENT